MSFLPGSKKPTKIKKSFLNTSNTVITIVGFPRDRNKIQGWQAYCNKFNGNFSLPF